MAGSPAAKTAPPTSNPATARTFYRAAACYAAIIEVQAEKQPKDEAAGQVRFFDDREEARTWILGTYAAEICAYRLSATAC